MSTNGAESLHNTYSTQFNSTHTKTFVVKTIVIKTHAAVKSKADEIKTKLISK